MDEEYQEEISRASAEHDIRSVPNKKLTVDETVDRASWRIDTSVLVDSVADPDALAQATLFSPLGAGLMSMTPSSSFPDPWLGEAAGDTRDLDEVASLPSGPVVRLERATTPPPSAAFPHGISNSSVQPLKDSERQICLDSFRDKGYELQGGYPIREAIDLYHALSTGHVNFSKVWMLVDPESVCKIGEDRFCAFIALVHSIVAQGDAVRLPGGSLDEADVKWLCGDIRQVEEQDVQEGDKDDRKEEEVTREAEAFYDVPLETSWRSAEFGEGVPPGAETSKGVGKKAGWSLARKISKLSLRNKGKRATS